MRNVMLMGVMLLGGVALAQGTVVPPAAPTVTPLPATRIAAPALPEMALPEASMAPRAPVQATPRPRTRNPQPARTPVTPAVPAVGGPVVTPPPQTVFGTLTRIRIIRTQVFEKEDTSNQIRMRGVSGPNPTQELSQAGTVFEFKLRPAQGWGIASLDDAKLVNVISQSGKALAIQPVPQNPATMGSLSAGSGTGLAGFVLPVELSPEEVIVQIRTELPPRADAALAKLTAEFKLTVGYRQPVKVMDLGRRTGQAIDIGQRDTTLVVNAVTRDSVELMATGAIDKIGAVTVTDLNGEPITPYATEMKADDTSAVKKKVWSLSFNTLPAIIGLNVDVYPVRQQTQPKYDWTNVPLP